MGKDKIFNKIGSLNVGRSMQDLSYSKITTCNMGELIPVGIFEVIPGDIFKMGNSIVCRAMPLVSPALHEINVQTYTFFVPNRILWPKPEIEDINGEPIEMEEDDGDWESFIFKGVNGKNNDTVPIWAPREIDRTRIGGLWDQMELPMQKKNDDARLLQHGIYPIALPKRAYNLIWNEYFRDQNYMNPIDLDHTNEDGSCLKAAWEKDYFTSALPAQQRGTAPTIPIEGLGSIEFTDDINGLRVLTKFTNAINDDQADANFQKVNGSTRALYGTDQSPFGNTIASLGTPNYPETNTGSRTLSDTLNMYNTIDFENAGAIDINTLRTTVQLQKWMERNMRAGVRYTEGIKARFPAFPRDERLDRPEFIGGTRSPVMINEVLQTSETTQESPQGNMAGHGLTADGNHIGNYRVEEYGYILTLAVIRPRTVYSNRIDRMYLKKSPFDFYFPEFQHLSEQPVTRGELSAKFTMNDDDKTNEVIIGFQGRYNELRYKPNQVCGEIRPEVGNMAHWSLARYLNPDNLEINRDFIECNPSSRIFAVEDTEVSPQFVLHYANHCRALRPMSILPIPGLMDHF